MDSFPQFGRLCPELRQMIWEEFMLADQRIIPVYIWDCGIRANPNLVSPLLSACKESRHQALGFYDSKITVSRVDAQLQDLANGPDPRSDANLQGFLYLNLDHDLLMRNIDTRDEIAGSHGFTHQHCVLKSSQQRQLQCSCDDQYKGYRDDNCPLNQPLTHPVGILEPADFLKVKKLCEKRHPGEEMIRAGVRANEIVEVGPRPWLVYHKHVHDLFPNLTSYHELVDTPKGRYNGKDGDLRLLDDLCAPELGHFGRNRDRLLRGRPLVCAIYVTPRMMLNVIDDYHGDQGPRFWRSFQLLKEKPLCKVKAPRKMVRMGLQMVRRSYARLMTQKLWFWRINPERISEADGDSVNSEDDEDGEDSDEDDEDSEDDDINSIINQISQNATAWAANDPFTWDARELYD